MRRNWNGTIFGLRDAKGTGLPTLGDRGVGGGQAIDEIAHRFTLPKNKIKRD
jgi:hypothetical protein